MFVQRVKEKEGELKEAEKEVRTSIFECKAYFYLIKVFISHLFLSKERLKTKSRKKLKIIYKPASSQTVVNDSILSWCLKVLMKTPVNSPGEGVSKLPLREEVKGLRGKVSYSRRLPGLVLISFVVSCYSRRPSGKPSLASEIIGGGNQGVHWQVKPGSDVTDMLGFPKTLWFYHNVFENAEVSRVLLAVTQ